MKSCHTPRPVAIAAALLITACGASVAAGDTAGADRTAQSGRPAIAKEMSAATIRQLIGQPVEVRKIETGGASGESWIYRRDMGTAENLLVACAWRRAGSRRSRAAFPNASE